MYYLQINDSELLNTLPELMVVSRYMTKTLMVTSIEKFQTLTEEIDKMEERRRWIGFRCYIGPSTVFETEEEKIPVPDMLVHSMGVKGKEELLMIRVEGDSMAEYVIGTDEEAITEDMGKRPEKEKIRKMEKWSFSLQEEEEEWDEDEE